MLYKTIQYERISNNHPNRVVRVSNHVQRVQWLESSLNEMGLLLQYTLNDDLVRMLLAEIFYSKTGNEQ